MENTRTESDVDQILGVLNDGLRKAEETMVSILEGVVADSAGFLSELEAALTDMEAALPQD